jgi:UDP-N-acetylmuramate dehydrogenase
VRVEAGVFLPTLARSAAERGRAGLEFAIGIPGSLGGAVRMNAGAAGSCMGELVQAVELAEVGPAGVQLTGCKPSFGYRTAGLDRNQLVLAARLSLARGDPGELLEQQAAIIGRRRSSQPTAARSAGCMFRNPGDESAGRLIDAAGLKGLQVGGAQVSTLHANFVLNRGGAGFDDVLRLLERVQAAVERHEGHRLVPEVAIWRARLEAPDAAKPDLTGS